MQLSGTFEGINGFALRVVGEVAQQTGKRLTAEDVQQQRTDHLSPNIRAWRSGRSPPELLDDTVLSSRWFAHAHLNHHG